ncbi:MAG TPA: hypothetical protein VJ255_21175, partial [Candidatus Acidoferrum sp.]|nr:hypothetical protein [Candidatus Acidoferrum sp.]
LNSAFFDDPTTLGCRAPRGVPMSETDQYWQYAREAMLSVGSATNDEERRDLLELARTWTQAALQGRAPPLVDRQEPRPVAR